MNKSFSSDAKAEGLSTDEFATQNLVQAASVIKRLSNTGSYHGVKPRKLANGRLLWPNLIVTAFDASIKGQCNARNGRCTEAHPNLEAQS